MPHDRLSRQQAEAVADAIARQLAYLNRLQRRMDERRFPPADPLYVAVRNARNSVQDLLTAARYAAAGEGRTGV